MYNSATYIMHFPNINMLIFCFYPYILKEGGHINFIIWYIFAFLVWYMAQFLPSETHWRKIVPKNKLQNKIQITKTKNKSKPTWKQSCQCHLGTNVPLLLGDNRASVTWEQVCQCTWELSCHCVQVTLVQFFPNDTDTIVPKLGGQDCS